MDRWILAFDATCGTCRQLAETTALQSAGRLEILPLDSEEVLSWRQDALGADAPWEPTLIRLRNDIPRAWTAPRLAVPLVRRLGPRAALRLLRALGELRMPARGTARGGLRRSEFLKLGSGVAAAVGMVLLGRTPALASPAEQRQAAREWVERNPQSVPTTFDGLVGQPAPYRQAIYETLTPDVRSGYWQEHLRRSRGTLLARAPMTEAQQAVLDQAMAVAADVRVFDSKLSNEVHERLEALRREAIGAFGLETSRGLLATFGTERVGLLACPTCNCNNSSDWCGSNCCLENCHSAVNRRCGCTNSGCGTFWQYPCNGHCASVSGACNNWSFCSM